MVGQLSSGKEGIPSGVAEEIEKYPQADEKRTPLSDHATTTVQDG
jgi:hypothetical protein